MHFKNSEKSVVGLTYLPGTNHDKTSPNSMVTSMPCTKDGIAMKICAIQSETVSTMPPGRLAHISPKGIENSTIKNIDSTPSQTVTVILWLISSETVIGPYLIETPRSPVNTPPIHEKKRAVILRS